jgi:putative transposase
MRILQLRAARGWNLEQTARVFLIDLQTLMIWMRRLDEQRDRPLIQTHEPVNRYPDFVRNLVRQLKRLFPSMGSRRMAQVLARAGLCLGPTTIRRMVREASGPLETATEATIARRRRRVVARYPGHTLHVDLTTVPTRAGFWVPWFPFSAPQRWPFSWWLAVAVDQVSRALVGFAVFSESPSSEDIQRFLTRVIRASQTPRYIVTDKGKQFWCRSFKRWCKPRGIRPRYGAVGEPASIAIVERFIRSMKRECTRCLLVPLSVEAMRREIRLYATWYNTQRPHTALAGGTPQEVYEGRAARRRRLEPRSKWPTTPRRRGMDGDKFRLAVSYVEGRRHLPVIELRRAA